MNEQTAISRCRAAAIILVISACLSLTASAQIPVPPRPAASAEGAPSSGVTRGLTAEDVEAFIDGFLPAQIERDDIAGAVIVIVRDGKILLGKGYGYSDLERKKPVSVDDTLFRPGSVSKLFVWTAVMQLVEQGKLDLDRDVNDYLDFQIRPAFSEPVTLRRIMTHTAGFEEVVKDLFISDAKSLTSLHDYLVSHQPERIFAPGSIPAYSNYATALAGYIIQRVSGEKFEDYIANHIYKPLGMIHTTFVQPLPASLEPLMSRGYVRASDGSKPYEVVQAFPAGSVAASGADMARFAIAHLQDGAFGDTRILKPETAKLMHSRAFAPAPGLLAMCLGFFEESRNGHTIIGHGGDTQYFHSHLHLILDSNVGLFISLNSLGKGETDLRELLWQKFLDRYFPYQIPTTPTAATAAADSAQVAGPYTVSRRAESSFLRALSLMGSSRFTARADGTITGGLFKSFNGKPKRWREIGPYLYQEIDGQERMWFRRDAPGRMTIFTDFAAFAFQRASLTETRGFNLSVLFSVLVIFVLTLILWPVAGLVRRHYNQPLNLDASGLRLRRWTRLVCAWNVLVTIGWASFFSYGSGQIGRLNSGVDAWVYLLQISTIIGGLGSIIALVNAYRSVTSSRWWWKKIQDVLIALACLGFVWMGFAWRLFYVGARF
jgi:CubicO group peptidase (beta-lactamase class C family)